MIEDDCVTVTDNRVGALGTTCASQTYTYSKTLRYDVCGDFNYDNTATFTTNTTQTTGSSTWNVQSHLDCSTGCTLTQGYWKTHSLHGPAPYDDAWLLVGPSGADTLFLNKSLSWYTVLTTPVAGRAWYALAHQFAAAKLNVLNGADSSALGTALAAAEALLLENAPDAKIRNSFSFPYLTGLLAQFNEGATGPGHCHE